MHFVNETNQISELNICFCYFFSQFRTLIQNYHVRFKQSLQDIQLCTDAGKPWTTAVISGQKLIGCKERQ